MLSFFKYLNFLQEQKLGLMKALIELYRYLISFMDIYLTFHGLGIFLRVVSSGQGWCKVQQPATGRKTYWEKTIEQQQPQVTRTGTWQTSVIEVTMAAPPSLLSRVTSQMINALTSPFPSHPAQCWLRSLSPELEWLSSDWWSLHSEWHFSKNYNMLNKLEWEEICRPNT